MAAAESPAVDGIPVALHRKQARFVKSEAFIKALVAGRGLGKTWVGAFDCIANSRHNDEIMAVSPSYVMLEDTTYPTFKAVAESLNVWIRGVKSPVPRIWFISRDGGRAEIVFRSGDNPDSLRGPSKSRLWLDEASLMHPDVLKFGLPVLRWKGRMGQLTMTMTPKGRNHWTFEVFYKRLGVVMDLERSEEGRQLLDDPRTVIFSGIAYQRTAQTELIQAHSLENPFLPPEYVANLQAQYTAQLADQELGGQFVLIVGDMFDRTDIMLIDMAPRKGQRVRYWDRASDETGRGSESSGCRMMRTEDDRFIIEDIQHGFWGPKQRDQMIEETAIRDAAETNNNCLIYIEQEGGSAGKDVNQQMIKRLSRFPVYSDIVSGKKARSQDGLRMPGEAKIVRARPVAAQAQAGNLYMVRGRYVYDALDQLTAFPDSDRADIVDSISGAYTKLAQGVGIKEFKAPDSMKRDASGAARFGDLLKDLGGKTRGHHGGLPDIYE